MDSATTRCFSSGSSPEHATSRSRFSATPLADSCTWANASVRSSGDTRKSSRRARRPLLTRACAKRWAMRRSRSPGLEYRSAGTVEFVVDDDERKFYFLEANTRLQVEHAVSEEVTGIDLVREQLRIAAGEPLGYGQSDVTLSGHAIEARLYAEDPASDFLPQTGTLHAFESVDDPAIRWESGVEPGSVVGVAVRSDAGQSHRSWADSE